MKTSLKLYYVAEYNKARSKALAGDARAAKKAAFYAKKLARISETVYPVS